MKAKYESDMLRRLQLTRAVEIIKDRFIKCVCPHKKRERRRRIRRWRFQKPKASVYSLQHLYFSGKLRYVSVLHMHGIDESRALLIVYVKYNCEIFKHK